MNTHNICFHGELRKYGMNTLRLKKSILSLFAKTGHVLFSKRRVKIRFAVEYIQFYF